MLTSEWCLKTFPVIFYKDWYDCKSGMKQTMSNIELWLLAKQKKIKGYFLREQQI